MNKCSFCNERPLLKRKNARTCGDYECSKKIQRFHVREWQRRNPEKFKKSSKEWKKNNTEKVKASSRKFYKSNREKCIKKINEWRKRNPEKVKLHQRTWRERNPGIDKEYYKLRKQLKEE